MASRSDDCSADRLARAAPFQPVEAGLQKIINGYRNCQVKSEYIIQDILTDKKSEMVPAGRRKSFGRVPNRSDYFLRSLIPSGSSRGGSSVESIAVP
jgi:hypothetical protein